jgi:predicted nuclease of predicted toxin-antitoxin system
VRVKVDEDLPQAVVDLLRRAGHDAIGVLDQGMGGWKDPVLWDAVQAEERFLITADKGLADIRRTRRSSQYAFARRALPAAP